jgi:hypothetical protein
MQNTKSSVPLDLRLLLVTALLVSSVALAGCTTTEDYSTSISEPTNGTVIQNLTVYDINELDGARYELEYRLNTSKNVTYTLKTYELKNESYELQSTSALTGAEPTYKNDLPPPWDAGTERTYRLEIVRADSETVLDAITITLKRDGD